MCCAETSYDARARSVLFCARLCHARNNQMMEGLDDLKVDGASPVVIMHNGDHMETLLLTCQGFNYHAQGTLEMLITVFGKPVVVFFRHAHGEEGDTLANLHRNPLRREQAARADMPLAHT